VAGTAQDSSRPCLGEAGAYQKERYGSYIVRIYRRESNNPQNLVGLIELVEVKQERAFTKLEELWAILGRRQVCIPADKKTTTRKND
jgi:hypothetical protein